MAAGRAFATAGAAFRQWRHPREFRIAAAPRPDDAPDPTRTPDGVPSGASDGGGLPDGTLADVATSLWRLRSRLERADDPPRPLVRHLETAWDALDGAGVTIRDHVGEPFDPGLLMHVVAYQPTPGLAREEVVEAVDPAVYLGERMLQVAKVIVGTPEDPAAAPAAPGGPAPPAPPTAPATPGGPTTEDAPPR